MDTALKQRLIGAAVLVALAVIFLPMLVNGPEPDTGAREVPLAMPDAPDRAFETRELPLGPPQPAPADAVAGEAPPADPDRLPEVDASAGLAPRVDALPVGDQPIAAATPDAAAPAPAAPAPAAATTRAGTDAVAPGQVAAATPPPPAPPPAPAPAPAPVASAPPPPAAAPATGARAAAGDWAVNLGAYANLANADALLARARAAGFPAYAEAVQVNGQPARRVRLGPYAQRAEAEAARGRAASLGAPAAVVALDAAPAPAAARPAAAPAAASPAPAAAPTTGFVVQVAAVRSQADANAMVTRLRGAGFAAFAESANTDAGLMWRVRAGPVARRDEAERMQAQIRQRLGLDGIVRPHP